MYHTDLHQSLHLLAINIWILSSALQVLLVRFNKQRQAKITQEISEIVAGANATG